MESVYDAQYAKHNAGRLNMYARFFEWKMVASAMCAQELRGKTVLEIGCNDGRFGQWLAQKYGAKVVGVDINEYAAAAARLDKFYVADAQRLPLKDASVDAVVGMHVIEHVDDPKETLLELRRVSKKKSRIVLTYPIELFRGATCLVSAKGSLQKAREMHKHKFGPRDMKRLFCPYQRGRSYTRPIFTPLPMWITCQENFEPYEFHRN